MYRIYETLSASGVLKKKNRVPTNVPKLNEVALLMGPMFQKCPRKRDHAINTPSVTVLDKFGQCIGRVRRPYL